LRAPRLLTQTRLPHGTVRSNSLAVGDDLLLVAYQVWAPGRFPWSWPSEEIIFGSFFSAGVRAFDIRDLFQPEQVAAFEPDGMVQINDVYVTADGIVYAVDRDGGGLYILEYSGPG
jgi:hypothetical protein